MVAVALLVALIVSLAAEQASAQDALRLCRERVSDDTLHALPPSLVPAAKRLLGLGRMPDQQVRRSTVFRCASGHVLLCNYGANLPCGKANTDRHPRGVAAWCHENPDADFVPNYARPSGSIFNWRCVGGASEVAGQVEQIDPRGFVAQYWKLLD